MSANIDNDDFTIDQSYHRRFENQAGRSPDAIALTAPDVTMTYRELNARANRLARRLRAAGVTRGTIVGIYLPRSADLVVSMLAVLKADGAFLALDPTYPAYRLEHILTDANPPILITWDSMRLAGFSGQSVDAAGQGSADSPADDRNLESSVGANSLAYVIYTSGTTGVPKGTLLTHRGLANYASALQPLSMTAEDVYLSTASSSFSSSIRQSLIPLCFGASVVLATADDIASPVRLFNLVKARHVTIIDLVPSYWRMCTKVLAQLPAEKRASLLDNQLRLVLSASEPLSSDLPRIWRRDFLHPAEFVNGYGHTETTGLVSLFRIPDRLLDSGTQAIPIGPPLANTAFDVWADDGGRVEVGGEGELYIRGASLARSYLHRPDLDAERFVAGPALPHEKSYRTGDIVRRLDDGTLEFVGRRDQQVKVNGVRVELGEIEGVLREHPSVDDVAIAFDDDDADDRHLVAYVMAQGSADLPAELRAFLSARLPASMIPSEFKAVVSLPRTSSGKIDRAQLKAITVTPAGSAPDATDGDVQREVAAAWSRVLRLAEVDVHANFFELGGDSLRAMELIAVLQQKFPTDVPMLALFFEEPTVSALARAIQETSSDTTVFASSGAN
jgi:amino acid adenylation domain-containing protein